MEFLIGFIDTFQNVFVSSSQNGTACTGSWLPACHYTEKTDIQFMYEKIRQSAGIWVEPRSSAYMLQSCSSMFLWDS